MEQTKGIVDERLWRGLAGDSRKLVRESGMSPVRRIQREMHGALVLNYSGYDNDSGYDAVEKHQQGRTLP